MSNKARYVLFTVAGMLVMLIGLILLATFAGDTEEERATTTPTPRPAPTSTLAIPGPTLTPVPSSTVSTPPTATVPPRPTPTRPPPTPEECPNAAERAYFDELGDNLGLMTNAAFEISRLSTQAASNVFLFASGDWKFKMAVQLGFMGAGAEGILGMNSPSSVSSVHILARRAAEDTRDSVRLYAQGIDNFDPDALEAALDLTESSAGFITRMGEAIRTFCAR